MAHGWKLQQTAADRFPRVVQYTRTVTVRIIYVTIRTDRKDFKMAYSP